MRIAVYECHVCWRLVMRRKSMEVDPPYCDHPEAPERALHPIAMTYQGSFDLDLTSL